MKTEIVTLSDGREVCWINDKPVDCKFPRAFMQAKTKMLETFPTKGNTWENMTPEMVEEIFEMELEEWKKSKDPDELLDVMNTAAMLRDVLQKK